MLRCSSCRTRRNGRDACLAELSWRRRLGAMKRPLLASCAALGSLALLTAFTACSSGEDSLRGDFVDDAGPGGGSSGSSGSSGTGGDGATPPDFGNADAGPGDDGCSDAARLVYVLSGDDELYSFDPSTLTFTDIGRLQCPSTGGDSTNSMAVDRSGTAWVVYQSGKLFKVDTATAACTATDYSPSYSADRFLKFGMGFSADSAGSDAESLFIVGIDDNANSAGRGLYRLDTDSLSKQRIGDFSGAQQGKGAELTGTGDGRLYGFFLTNPATMARIDKDTGATSDVVSLDSIRFGTSGYAFAFSFWGGDFWFYHSTGTSPSKVTRLRASGDGSQEEVVSNVGGFRIVGAGVSTCAPTSPVN